MTDYFLFGVAIISLFLLLFAVVWLLVKHNEILTEILEQVKGGLYFKREQK